LIRARAKGLNRFVGSSCLVCSVEVSLQLIRPFVCAAVALAFTSVAPAFAADNSSPDYRVTKSIALGSGERWDYVTFDPTGKRVYVAHGDHVTVVDETKGEVIGQIGYLSRRYTRHCS